MAVGGQTIKKSFFLWLPLPLELVGEISSASHEPSSSSTSSVVVAGQITADVKTIFRDGGYDISLPRWGGGQGGGGS